MGSGDGAFIAKSLPGPCNRGGSCARCARRLAVRGDAGARRRGRSGQDRAIRSHQATAYCDASTATIVRMTRHLGFDGYSDFKYFLRHESRLGRGRQKDGAPTAARTLAEDITQTIRLFERTNQLDELYARMAGARKVYAFDTGYGQRLMLEDFCRCMQMIGRDVVMIPATGELRLVRQFLGRDDLLIIASLSGCVDRYRDVFQAISVCGTPIVSITNLGNNELASYTAYSLYFQNGNIFDDINMSSSSFVTMHVVLHLLFEGFKAWVERDE